MVQNFVKHEETRINGFVRRTRDETSAVKHSVKQFWLKNKAIFPISGIISVNVLTFSLKPCGFVVVVFLWTGTQT